MSIPQNRCEFCSGTVKQTIARNDSILTRDGIVLIEGFTIGKCDRYFPLNVVKRAEHVAANLHEASEIVQIPVVGKDQVEALQ